ncbi:MAG: bifunctional oligoribonuclease/PAP phosphatase NrnA [Treponema sp.]|nr:bifunctional oligoribonuclease/PAP phosphatase NrnA [Treponema sp.]
MNSGLNNPDVQKDLVEFIKTGSSFIIAGHKEPDGDCVGSQLALRSALLRLGKETAVCSAGPYKRTELYDFVKQFCEIPENFDSLFKQKDDIRVIIVDCSGRERTGELHDLLKKYPYAIIDHHAAVTHPPSTAEAPVYIEATSPSCTLLIFKLIKALGMELTQEEAELLLFGLCTDTGFFRHMTEKNSYAFNAAAEMIHYGASPKKIFNIINGGKSLNSRKLIGNILARTESYYDGRLLVSCEKLEEYSIFGFESRDSDSLNQMMLSIKGVEATIIIRQESADNCTVSLRSTDKINVAEIAASFNGGGHKNAAGLSIKGDISSVKQILLKSFSNYLGN